MVDTVPSYSSRRALSLVEILVAGSILAVILTPVLFTFMSGSRGMDMTREEMIGQHAGVELVEQLMTIPFEWLPAGEFREPEIFEGGMLGASCPFPLHVSIASGTQRNIRISEETLPGGLRIKRIRVSVLLQGSAETKGNRLQVFESVVSRHE